MDYQSFINAAQGKTKPDLVIRNVSMLMVATGEWMRGDLALSGELIAGAGPESYEGSRIIDGSGLFAVPGFIDSHVHIESSHTLPSAFAEAVLPHGTTTAVCDPHELANVCGAAGIRYFLECAERLQLDLFVQLSSCVPACSMDTSGAVLEAEDLVPLKNMPRACGLAEMMNVPGLLNGDPAVIEKLRLFSGHPIDGHSPFLEGRALNAYCGCGIGSDHECSTVKEALDRIRRGMTVLIREGSLAKNAVALSGAITPETVDFTALCTDDRSILDILTEGHIDHVIRLLIHAGVAPELVYRAASLSAARYFRLYDRGMLAPGKIADFVLLDNVEECRIRAVFKRGKNVSEMTCTPEMPDHSFALNSIRRAPLSSQDFRIFSEKPETPVIGIIPESLTTNRIDMLLPVDENGEKHALLSADVTKICVIARHGINNNIGRGFVCGFGMKSGAIASSVGHDSHNICVTGCSDEDMALAVNTLIRCGGGYTAVKDGKILASVPFPVGGLMSDKEGPLVAEEQGLLFQAVRETGCRLKDPFMQLAFLTLPVIPFLKITDKGVFDTVKMDFAGI